MNGNGPSKTEGHLNRRPAVRRWAAPLVCLAAATALSACGDWRQTFGLDHAPPDEFTVVSQAPLSMPPDFNLRPPRPGAVRPQDSTPTDTAAATVFGIARPPGAERVRGTSSSDEAVFLAHAGAANAQPNIRATIDAETRNLVAADKSWVDTLMFWQKQQPPGTVVDAAAEAKRLHDNAALGQPVTAGETPSIERKRKAPLEGIF